MEPDPSTLSINQRLSHLVGNPLLSDLTFHITSENINIPAHQNIVISASLVLKHIILGSGPCIIGCSSSGSGSSLSSTTIEVDDITSNSFLEVLRFIYTDWADVNVDNVMEILLKANYYGLKKLDEFCQEYLVSNYIQVENVLNTYQNLYPLCEFNSRIIKKSTKLIKMWCSKLLDTESFLQLDSDTLQKILQINYLNCKEIKLFNKLLVWIEHNLLSSDANTITPTPITTKVVQNDFSMTLKFINKTIRFIRFASMSTEDFDACLYKIDKYKTLPKFQDTVGIDDNLNKLKNDMICIKNDKIERNFYTCFDAIWEKCSNLDEFPTSAFYACNIFGYAFYVARAVFDNELRPVLIRPDRHVNNILWRGIFYEFNACETCEILVGTGYRWKNHINHDDEFNESVVIANSDTHNTTYYVIPHVHMGLGELDLNDVNKIKIFDHGIVNVSEDFRYLIGSKIKQPYTNHEIPNNAVIGSILPDGTKQYIGRIFYSGDILPARITCTDLICEARSSWNCHSRVKQNFEWFCYDHEDYYWIADRNGHVPENAIPGGRTQTNEILYFGRARHQTNESQSIILPGKIHPSHNCLYVGYNELEISFNDYEVLVSKTPINQYFDNEISFNSYDEVERLHEFY